MREVPPPTVSRLWHCQTIVLKVHGPAQAELEMRTVFVTVIIICTAQACGVKFGARVGSAVDVGVAPALRLKLRSPPVSSLLFDASVDRAVEV